MSRVINRGTRGDAADPYRDQLLKLIPAEVVAFYLAFTDVIAATQTAPPYAGWLLFAFGVVATPIYLRYQEVPALQWIISTLAFVLWAFALGGPFARLAWYSPLVAAILVAGFTLLAPKLLPAKKPAGVTSGR